jgi:hypothetical protein
MTLTRLQRFGPWLVGLFLIAQVAGVIPALYVDTLHEYEAISVVTDARAGIVSSQPAGHDNERAIHVGHDQCCALHHGVVGVVPFFFTPAVTSVGRVVLETLANALVTGDSGRLDRPPRPLPLI